MAYRSVFTVALLFVLSFGGTVRAATLDEAIRQLVEAHSRLHAYQAAVKSRENLDFGEGNALISKVTGTVRWMRKGDKILFRSDAESESIQRFNNVETPTRATTTMIFDGEFFYTIQNMMDELHVAKRPPNPLLAANAKAILDELKTDHNLRLLHEEKWQGAPCFVIEATPKEPEKTEHMVRVRYYFRKDTGTAVRTMGFDKKGSVAYLIEHYDVERNPDIDPKLFEFVMPEGAKLTDYVNP